MYRPHLIGSITNHLSEQKKQVCLFADNFDFDHGLLEQSEVKVFLQCEPKQFNRMQSILPHSEKFDLILTHQQDILDSCKNSLVFPWGDCWISDSEQKIHDKTEMFSIIASHKNHTRGHQLRHEVIKLKNPRLIPFGPQYNDIGAELNSKIKASKNFAFQVVIENESWENCFTEKLIDCLRTGSVPIYWGCNNIENFFDTRGFYVVNSLNEIDDLLKTLTMDDYLSKMEYVKNNFLLSEKYLSVYKRVDNIVRDYINQKYFTY